jgi:hypothetical protein
VNVRRKPSLFALGEWMKNARNIALWFCAAVSVWCLQATCSASEDAAEVLRQAGIRGGLIARLGCGDGKLTAARGRGSDGGAFVEFVSLGTGPQKIPHYRMILNEDASEPGEFEMECFGEIRKATLPR